MAGVDAFIQAMDAALGGGFSTLSLFPLEVLKTKFAVNSGADKLAVIKDLLEKEGIAAFYKGASMKCGNSMLGKFMYFFYYYRMKNAYKSAVGPVPPIMDVVFGLLSEFGHLPLSVPFDVISTRLQTSAASPDGKKMSFWEIIKSHYEQGGIANFYKGFYFSMLCAFQPALQYMLYERARAVLIARSGSPVLSAVEAFVLGAATRAVATTVVFPMIRAKTIAQFLAKQPQGADAASGKEHPTVISEMLRGIREEGILSIFSGLAPELLRGVLSSAVMMMVKEKIHNVDSIIVKGALAMLGAKPTKVAVKVAVQ